MRILLLANNWVGWKIAAWLKERGDEVVGLVLHPPSKRKYGDEIVKALVISPAYVFDGSQLRQPQAIKAIENLKAEIGLSVFFGYILNSEFLHIFPAGVVNVHPSYLPYNRGANPNVWSIVDGTPAGATIHYIDEGIDTGKIIAQNLVPIKATDTGKTLYHTLEMSCVELFKETWSLIESGLVQGSVQLSGVGTVHKVSDVEKLDEIQLDRSYTARELINILRARTFPPYPGAYFWDEGRKVYLRLQLVYEDEPSY